MTERYELVGDFMETPLDLLQALVCYGLANRKYMYSHIDRIYKTQSDLYHQTYLNSDLYDHPILGICLQSTRDYFGKVSGIIVHEYQTGKSTSTMSLINRRFKTSFKYFQSNKDLDLTKFAEILLNTEKEFISVSDDELDLAGLVLEYLRRLHPNTKQVIVTGEYGDHLTDIVNLTKMRINLGESFLNRVAKDYKDRVHDNCSVDDFWPFTDKRLTIDVYLGRMRAIYNFKQQIYKPKMFSDLNLKPKYKDSPGSLLRVARLLNSQLQVAEIFLTGLGVATKEFLADIEITEKDMLDWILVQQYLIADPKADKLADICSGLVMILYLRGLVSGYSSLTARVVLEQQTVEGLRIKLKEMQEALTSEEESKQVQIASTEPVDYFERERELLKQVRDLQRELELKEEHGKELAALRSYVYQEQQMVEDIYPSVDHMVETIQSKRIVIVGGHPNWLAKVRSRLPKVKILEVSEKHNAPMDSILKADLVVMVYAQIGHTTWDRAMTYAERSSGALHIMTERVNEEETIRELYKAVKEL